MLLLFLVYSDLAFSVDIVVVSTSSGPILMTGSVKQNRPSTRREPLDTSAIRDCLLRTGIFRTHDRMLARLDA